MIHPQEFFKMSFFNDSFIENKISLNYFDSEKINIFFKSIAS